MLIVNEQDIEKAISPTEMLAAIERAYLIQNQKNTLIPNRMHIDREANTLLLMPGFIEGFFGTKIVTVFPGNTIRNQPAINGLMVLNDGSTGKPVAVLNGNKLTALRTGGVGALAVRYLAAPAAETLGIIGAGVQAFHQALIICKTWPFRQLLICDTHREKAGMLVKELGKKLGQIKIIYTKNPNQLVKDSDVIVTVTSSQKPVFDLKTSRLKNKTFIGIGSYKPDMQEMPLVVSAAAGRVYVDTLHAKKESGDLKTPLESGLLRESDIIPFGELVRGERKLADCSVRFFKSVGMSLFDLTFAELIYRNAKQKGLGTEVSF